jgi:hypothetical protein
MLLDGPERAVGKSPRAGSRRALTLSQALSLLSRVGGYAFCGANDRVQN